MANKYTVKGVTFELQAHAEVKINGEWIHLENLRECEPNNPLLIKALENKLGKVKFDKGFPSDASVITKIQHEFSPSDVVHASYFDLADLAVEFIDSKETIRDVLRSLRVSSFFDWTIDSVGKFPNYKGKKNVIPGWTDSRVVYWFIKV